MRRLLSTILWDTQLQFRQGFYYAGAFVAVIWIVLFTQVPSQSLLVWIPPFIFLNLIMTTFYFMAGLVLLEKDQLTLESLVVTPLRRGEYLAAKIITLTILALIEGIAIVGFGFGLNIHWGWLLTGLLAAGVLYTLLGFVAVSRYDSINQFLLPSGLVITILTLPMLGYFDLWDTPLFYLIPTQAPLLLLKAAVSPLSGWQMGYALVGSLVWIGASYWLSLRVFERFITRRAG